MLSWGISDPFFICKMTSVWNFWPDWLKKHQLLLACAYIFGFLLPFVQLHSVVSGLNLEL
jgi:hypothetical protein